MPQKTYRITLTTTADIDQNTYDFYKDNPADLHEALTTLSEKEAKLTIEETKDKAICYWITE